MTASTARRAAPEALQPGSSSAARAPRRLGQHDRDLLARHLSPVSGVTELGLRELCHEATRRIDHARHLLAAVDSRESGALSALDQLLTDFAQFVQQAEQPRHLRQVELRAVLRGLCADAALFYDGTITLVAPTAVLVSADPLVLRRALDSLLDTACTQPQEAPSPGAAGPAVDVSVRAGSEGGVVEIDYPSWDATAPGLALCVAQVLTDTCGGNLLFEHHQQRCRVVVELPLAVAG